VRHGRLAALEEYGERDVANRSLLLPGCGGRIVLVVDSTFSADERAVGLWEAWAGDGRPLLAVGSLALIVAGAFAWFLALTDQLLPHDLAWLTISASELRAIAGGRLVHFMSHDRAAFGGTLIAIGVLYLWLVRFPLAAGRRWAWWTLATTSGLGFLTFLSYLGTGYLDTWHGVATLGLLPLFGVGLWRTRAIGRSGVTAEDIGTPLTDRAAFGRSLLLLTGFGMLTAGAVIVTLGSAVVFVPQDLQYIGLDRAALDAIDPRLVALIAHDRAGFGGGLATTGLATMAIMWFAPPSRALWQALALAGLAGFGAAIGVHGLIGYLDGTHVGPAVVGALVFSLGLGLTHGWTRARPEAAAAGTEEVRNR
jgi:hypothetical protein